MWPRLVLPALASVLVLAACGGPRVGPDAPPASETPPAVESPPAAETPPPARPELAQLGGCGVAAHSEGRWWHRVASCAVPEPEPSADGDAEYEGDLEGGAAGEGAVGYGAGFGSVHGVGSLDTGGGLVHRGTGRGGGGSYGRVGVLRRGVGVVVGAPPRAGEDAPATTADEPAEEVRDSLDELASDGAEPDGGAVAPVEDAAPLRAGTTDDNADLPAFLAFLAEWLPRDDVKAYARPVDVRDRRTLRVVDRRGRPVPGARVQVTDEAQDRVVWEATTYADGQAPFYPALAGPAPAGAWRVAAFLTRDGGRATAERRWDGAGETFEVALDERFDPDGAVPVDVLFLLDTTGSMSDEIDRIKETLLRVTAAVRALDRPVDLRYGAILYRDLDDLYLTAAHPFTTDVDAFDEALQGIAADGGGDDPESLNQGLHEAVHRMRWREGAARLVFLVADAPPHMDYEGDTLYPETLREAVAAGIRIHAVAASGLNPGGTVVFRQVAQFTRGQFIFIEYGSIGATAASHGVAGEPAGNNLDAILLDRIRWEVEHWGAAEVAER